MELSAIDLIKMYLDLKGLQPNLNEWDDNSLSDNPPRYYRYRQLKVLFDVFALGDFVDFEKGKFLKNHKIEEYHTIIEKANRYVNEYEPEHYKWLYVKEDDLSEKTLIQLFENLFFYRIKLNTLITHNSGVVESSGLSRYAVSLTNRFSSSIKKELYKIDDVLSLLISPSGKSFTINELITKYNYPEVDLDEIDSDWV